MKPLRVLVRNALERESREEEHVDSETVESTSEDESGLIVIEIEPSISDTDSNAAASPVQRNDAPAPPCDRCWLCEAPLDTSLTFTVPLESSPRLKGRRRVCGGCFGLCYRTLYVPHLLGHARRQAAALGVHSNKSVELRPLTNSPLQEAGRSVLTLVREVEPKLMTALISAAPKCPRCRTACPLSRNSQDGLPGSLCIDGQPHVRWRCVYCWRQHTRGGSVCDGCGRGDGAHQWQCPACLHCGCDGAADPRWERVGHQTEGDYSSPDTPQQTDAEADDKAGSPAAEPPHDPYRGAGGRCRYCNSNYASFIHDCGLHSGVAAEVSLRPYESQLRGCLTGFGFTCPPACYLDTMSVLAQCFFGDASEHHVLRQLLAGYMEAHADTYENYFYLFTAHKSALWQDTSRHARHGHKAKRKTEALKGEGRQPFEDYLSRLRSGRSGGDELCLQAAARLFRVVLHVFTAEVGRWHVLYTGEEPAPDEAPGPSQQQRHRSRSASPSLRSAASREVGGGTRNYIRRWAPLSIEPATDCDESGEDATCDAQQPSVEAFLLVDERLSHQAEQHLLEGERAHVFMRRSTPSDGYALYENKAVRLVPSLPALLRVIGDALATVADDICKAEEARKELERRPEVPSRLPPPSLQREGDLDNETDLGRTGRPGGGDKGVGGSRGRIPRGGPPKARMPPRKCQPPPPPSVKVRPSPNRAPPARAPSRDRLRRSNTVGAPPMLEIPARAGASAPSPPPAPLPPPQAATPSSLPPPPARVGRRRSVPAAANASANAPHAAHARGATPSPDVPRSRAARTARSAPPAETVCASNSPPVRPPLRGSQVQVKQPSPSADGAMTTV